MLQLIFWAVRILASVALPLIATVGIYLLAIPPALPLGTLSLITLWAAFAALGTMEAWLYLRELRSVVPRPLVAAGRFVTGLALAFFATAASFLVAYAAADYFGLPAFVPSLASALAVYSVSSWFVITPDQEYVRGRKYRSFREVFLLSKVEGLFQRKETIFWGGIRLPWSSAVKHWLILGVTGAGKTMLFQGLFQDVLRGRIGAGRDERGLVYDNKTEIVPLLSAMGVPYKIVHPFDRRGVSLDIQGMVPTHTHALELASILMPQAPNVGTDPFWVKSPRNLLASVLTSLRLGLPKGSGPAAPIDWWDFRDVVLIMQSQERIREIITRHAQLSSDIEGYFDDPRLLANVMASVKTQMLYYRPIAACWHRAPEKLNLTDAVWGDEPYVLVLGNDEQFRKAIDPINQVVITRYGQLALRRPKSATRRIWFFLDEFPDLKRLDANLVTGLMTKGRSKGICMVLGIQSLPSVVAEYGREAAKVILSQPQSIAILGLGDLDDETTEYAERVIGQLERFEHRENETPTGLLTRRSRRQELRDRPVVLSSEFSDLPETVKRNGLAGFYRTRSIRGFWGSVIPGSYLAKTLLKPDPGVPAIVEREEAEHDLDPWTKADLARLGLTPKSPEAAPDEPQKAIGKPFKVYRGGKRAA